MRSTVEVEWWKVRRSRVTLTATLLMGLVLPALGVGFYLVAVNGGSGPVAGKAGALLTAEGWEGYLGLVSQIAAVAGFLGVGVVVAWVFGREHTDGTFSTLFARPVPRQAIALAKFTVMIAWIGVLSLVIAGVAVGLGVLARVGAADPIAAADVVRLVVVTLGAGALGLTMGYVASVGRGYLVAIGVLIVIIAISQVAVLFGTGAWFPYAVPGLLAVAGTDGIPTPSPLQIALVPALAAAGGLFTVRWWRRAEVK